MSAVDHRLLPNVVLIFREGKMLRLVSCALVLFVLLANSALPAFAATSCVKISASRVNIRSSPGGRCIGSLGHGQKFKIHPCSGGWCRLDRNNPSYIATQFRYQGHIVKSFKSATRCKGMPSLGRCIGS
jgi:uncharacterized protein YraI